MDMSNGMNENLPLYGILAMGTYLFSSLFAPEPTRPQAPACELPEVYDFDRITEFTVARPLQTVARAVEISWAFFSFWLTVTLDEFLGRTTSQLPQQAIKLRTTLTTLGPTFIKVGQSLSCRPDLVRRDYLEELVLLQDSVPSFPNEEAMDIFYQEVGRPINECIKDLTPNPVAAASLGQVYRGRLATGEEVAVKIQRPNLKPQLMTDVFLLRTAAPLLAKLLPVNLGFSLDMIVDEFGRSLFNELNYHMEASNAQRFAKLFRDDPTIKVPVVYPEISGSRVLVLEWIEGFRANDAMAVEALGLDNNELIRIGVVSGLRQLLEYGFFHADPHPGNIFVMYDGRLAYIDFGMMASLTQEAKETLVDALVHLVNEDYSAVVEDFIALGFLPRDTNVATIVPALRLIWEDAIGEKVQDFNFKSVTDRFSDLVYQYPFRVPAEFALVIRSLLVQEGISLDLNPDFRILEVAYPYVAKRLLTDESPRLRRRLLEVLFKDGEFQWQRLENLIGIALLGGKLDLRPTARLAVNYILSPEGEFLRRELVRAMTEGDRLHTVELQRLWDLVKGELTPELVTDMAGIVWKQLAASSPFALPTGRR